jgi:hypothetical protein
MARAKEFTEIRDLLVELLRLPASRLLPIFGITQWNPTEVHGLKDHIFFDLGVELARGGWRWDVPAFGEGRRDTLLMEMARHGLPKSVARLLELGAEADYNNQGYGASTPLMCTRDPEIMKKLLYYGANPLASNALGQTDFTYKLLKGWTNGARFYLYNTEKIPFQSLLANFKDCVLSHFSVPYEPMYPLCLVPVIPKNGPYQNIIDKALIDHMLQGHYLPFSSKALRYSLGENLTVWQHVKLRIRESKTVVPALAVGYMACMVKLEEARTPDDFSLLESYIEKPIPREIVQRESLSKSIFVYLLFALSSLPSIQILRWLALISKFLRKAGEWMNLLGDEPFKVVNSLAADSRGSHMLQELVTLQALLAMRVNVTDSFGEFHIPEEFTTLFAMNDSMDR